MKPILAAAAAALLGLALPAGAAPSCPPATSPGWKAWQACNQKCVESFGLQGDPSGACEDACDSSVPGHHPNVVAACAVCRSDSRIRGKDDEGRCVEKILKRAAERQKQ